MPVKTTLFICPSVSRKLATLHHTKLPATDPKRVSDEALDVELIVANILDN